MGTGGRKKNGGAQVGTREITWEQVKEWDLKYCMHPLFTREELKSFSSSVERVDANFIYFADGSKVLDLQGQCMSVAVGFRHPRVAAAIKEATDNFGFASEFFPTRHKSLASKLLLEDLLGPDGWAGAVRWVCSGSEANEMALNIARLYTNRPNIMTREWSYHGWTTGAAACSQLRGESDCLSSAEAPLWTRNLTHKPSGFYVAPGHNCYRCSLGHRYPSCKMSNGMLPCVRAIESMITTIGADTVAGIITEIAYGSGGVLPAEEYFPQVRQVTKEMGILWIDDEILMGMGRLGTWWAYQAYGGATPDIMTVGKGVSSSQLPVGGVVVSKEIADFFAQNRWSSLATFFAHPLVMAAVAANIETMIDEKIVENSARIGGYFGKKLGELQERHKCVGQVSGRGCFWVIELVKNRESREPFFKEDRGADIHTKDRWPSIAVSMKMAEKSVSAGSILPNTLVFAPNLCITEPLIDMACEAIDHGLSVVDEKCD